MSLSLSRTASSTWPSLSWCWRSLPRWKGLWSGSSGTREPSSPLHLTTFLPEFLNQGTLHSYCSVVTILYSSCLRDNIYFSIWDCWTISGHEDFTLSDFMNAVRVRTTTFIWTVDCEHLQLSSNDVFNFFFFFFFIVSFVWECIDWCVSIHFPRRSMELSQRWWSTVWRCFTCPWCPDTARGSN